MVWVSSCVIDFGRSNDQWPLQVPKSRTLPYIYKLCQAYFKIGYVRGYTPNFYGEIYGTFTYLHVLDPFLFPLTIVYQVSKIHHPYIAHITRDVSIYSWHTLGLLHMIANLVSGMHIQVYTYCHVMGTYIWYGHVFTAISNWGLFNSWSPQSIFRTSPKLEPQSVILWSLTICNR